jgi:hypothetical protein
MWSKSVDIMQTFWYSNRQEHGYSKSENYECQVALRLWVHVKFVDKMLNPVGMKYL